jgi:tRNA(Ile)-lysidine synthetase-like protein
MTGFGRQFLSELRRIFTDSGVLLIMVGAVVLYSFVYPLPYSGEVLKELKVAVVDLDRSAMSRNLIRMADGGPLSPPPRPVPVALGPDLPASGYAVPFAGLRFTLTPADPAQPPPDGLRTVEVPLAALPGLQLRLPDAGARIRPFGAQGGKPLRRYLTDRKVDRPFRPWLPLLCAGGEVLWAVGLGAAEGTRRTGCPAVRLTAEGPLPWADRPA